ncbi:protein of unknown function [Nocardia cyriacigeorgica GUH-2]|uniref:Uncharacterized protein n=1 Tax=Nocardia cyriacigeorgica (strain GUH-2) TaxID=1127134 RepID=H6R1Q1_NOCCG|nr:protein of unknown function [Nocardia cyriacigeorgica GUH-2]
MPGHSWFTGSSPTALPAGIGPPAQHLASIYHGFRDTHHFDMDGGTPPVIGISTGEIINPRGFSTNSCLSS